MDCERRFALDYPGQQFGLAKLSHRLNAGSNQAIELLIHRPGGLLPMFALFERFDPGQRLEELFDHPQDVVTPEHS